MAYSKHRPGSMPPWLGFGMVVLAHVAVIYALASGLARRVVEVVRAPVETLVIDEMRKEPPPPEPPPQPPPPPPRMEAPRPPVTPPPVAPAAPPAPVPPPVAPAPPPPVAVEAPPAPAPPAVAPAPAPVVAAPPAPAAAPAPAVAVAAPPPVVNTPPAVAPPAPAAPPVPPPATRPTASAGVVCPNYEAVLKAAGFPQRAARAGLDKGVVVLKFTMGPGGKPKDVIVVRQSHAIFGRAAAKVVAEEVVCDEPEGREVLTPEITYNATN